MVSYVLSGAAFLLAVWFMLSIALRFKPFHRAIFKWLAGVGFIAVGIAAYIEGSASVLQFVYVLLGLFFGMVGDFMLAFRDVKPHKKDLFLLLGIAAFAIGHILYILLYSTLFQITILQPTIALVAAILVILSTKLLKMNFKNMLLPVFIYAFVILFMLTCAVTALIVLPITVGKIILTVGAGLFVVSDMVLCFIFFKDKVPKVLGVINLTTYFSAQILIALSLLFL